MLINWQLGLWLGLMQVLYELHVGVLLLIWVTLAAIKIDLSNHLVLLVHKLEHERLISLLWHPEVVNGMINS